MKDLLLDFLQTADDWARERNENLLRPLLPLPSSDSLLEG